MQNKKVFNKSDKILIAIVGSLLALPTIFNIGVIVILWFWVLNDGADEYKIKRDRELHEAFLERMQEEGRLLPQEKLGYEKFDCVLSEDGQWKEYHGAATMLGEVLFYDKGEAYYDDKRDKNGNVIKKRFAFKVRPVNLDTLSAVKVILRDMEDFFQQDDNWIIKNYLIRNYNEGVKVRKREQEWEEEKRRRLIKEEEERIQNEKEKKYREIEFKYIFSKEKKEELLELIGEGNPLLKACVIKHNNKKMLYVINPTILHYSSEYELNENEDFESFVDRYVRTILKEGGTSVEKENCRKLYSLREHNREEKNSEYQFNYEEYEKLKTVLGW